MNTFETILLGAFPFVALACVGVIFYINRHSHFEEAKQDKKRDKEQLSERPTDTN